MGDVDAAACWSLGLWTGIVERLVRERLAPDHPRGPYAARARAADAACVRRAVAREPHLAEAGARVLALLEA